jgi:hypothetical protein
MHNNKKLTNLGCAGRAPSLRVIPFKLRKKYGKTSAKVAARTTQADTVQYKKNEQYNTQKKNSNTEQCDVIEHGWLIGTRQSMPFAVPIVWRELKDHLSDCKFGFTIIDDLISKSKTCRTIRLPTSF